MQHWRETFAEKLREQGIEANATPRKVRGVVQKAEKRAIRHIDRDHAKGRRKAPARVSASQREALNQWLETAGVRVVSVETLWTASGERHERGLRLWYESNPK